MFSSEQIFPINGDNDNALKKVLQLALDLSGRSIKAFYKDTNGLVLLCSNGYDKSIEYPFEATIPVLVEHINQYIKYLSNTDILRLAGNKPNIDGTVRLGWEIFHPVWYGDNCIENYDDTFVIAIRPSWIVYHK